MKKLVIFLLIALMANVGSAAMIDILVNGNPWTGDSVRPSDIITVTWVNTDVGVWGGFGDFLINVSNGDQVGGEWIHTSLLLPFIEIIPKEPGYDVYMGGGGMPTPEGPIAGWEFHVPDYKQDSDLIIIDPYSGTFNNVVAIPGADDGLPYVVLHVTPEPTTIALLGLGGLFLLRRRK